MEKETSKGSATTSQFLYICRDSMISPSAFTSVRLETALTVSNVSGFSLRVPPIYSHVLVMRVTNCVLFVSTVPLDMLYS
jgi:hypothetical protein